MYSVARSRRAQKINLTECLLVSYSSNIEVDCHQQPSLNFFLVVSRLIQEIDSRALKTKGIYRVNGVKNRVENICSSFTMNSCSMDLSVASEHDMSSVLKRYLHDLPQPLFTHALYPQLLALR